MSATAAASLVWLSMTAGRRALNEFEIAAATLVLGLILLAFIYSINIRVENIILRKIAEDFYEINRIYRSKLMLSLSADRTVSSHEARLKEEAATLRAVAQRISRIFTRVTGRHCVTTIKLVTEQNDNYFVRTYVRSEDLSLRDLSEHPNYELNSKKNTAFSAACRPRSDGLPRHFFSNDLRFAANYNDQRQHFLRYYRSILTVPIQGLGLDDSSESSESDIIGFLTVDTMSVNRLNNNYHAFMLAALASQI